MVLCRIVNDQRFVGDEMSLITSMVSSKSNEWATPKRLYKYLNEHFCNFTLDPCSTHENKKCEKHYTIEDDGLTKSWAGERVFVNPPYGGHTRKWIQKAIDETRKGKCDLVVMLIVSSTDRSYWHDLICKEANEIWFLRGRCKFNESKSTAPFASAIVIFKPDAFRTINNKAIVKFVDLREHHQ